MPDSRLEVRRVVADGAVAAVEWTMRGTFSGGPFQGIRATGKRVEIEGVDVIEVRDGLQYRNSIYYDGATFARQIGMLPPLGSRADRTLLALFNVRARLRRPGAEPRLGPGRQAVARLGTAASADRGRPERRDSGRSNRSRFITLPHAATKSCRNLSFESSHA